MNIPKNLMQYGDAINQISTINISAAGSTIAFQKAVQGLDATQIASLVIKNKSILISKLKTEAELAEYLSTIGLTKEKAAETAAITFNTGAKGANSKAAIGQTVSNLGLLGSIKAVTTGLLAQAAAWAMTPMGMTTIATGVIFALTSAFNNYKKSIQESVGKVKELADTHKQAQGSISYNVSSLESLRKEYDELSKGVDKQGKNISLSTEEYEKYNSIVQQVIDKVPDLIDGYDSEGKAIIQRNDLIDKAIVKQKEYYDVATATYLNTGSSFVEGINAANKQLEEALGYSGFWNGKSLGEDIANQLYGGFLGRWGEQFKKDYSLIFGESIGQKFGLNVSKLEKGDIDQLNIIRENMQALIEAFKMSDAEAEKFRQTVQIIGIEMSSNSPMISEYTRYLTTWAFASKEQGGAIASGFEEFSKISDEYIETFSKGVQDIANTPTPDLATQKKELLELAQLYLKVQDVIPAGQVAELNKKFDEGTITVGDYESQVKEIQEMLKSIGVNDTDFLIKLGFDINLEALKTSIGDSQDELKGMEDEILKEFSKDEIDIIIKANPAVDFSGANINEVRLKFNAYKKEVEEAIRNESFAITQSDITEKSNLLNKAMDEQSRTGKISRESYEELYNKGEDYRKLLDILGDNYVLLSDNAGKFGAELVKQSINIAIANGATEDQISSLKELLGTFVSSTDFTKTLNDSLDNYNSTTNEFEKTHWADIAKSALADIKKECEESGEGWDNYERALKNVNNTVSGLSNSMSALQNVHTLLSDVEKEMDENGGKIFIGTLNKIVQTYPQMESSVLQYNAGLIKSKELYALLDECYEENKKKFIQANKDKLLNDATFYQNVLDKNKELTTLMAALYGEDYKNWASVNAAKLGAETLLVEDLKKIWDDWENYVTKNKDGSYTLKTPEQKLQEDIDSGKLNTTGDMLTDYKLNNPLGLGFHINSFSQEDIESNKQKWEDAKKRVQDYSTFLKEFNNVFELELNVDFGNINFDDSKSSSKNEFSKTFDWFERKIKSLSDKTAELKDNLEKAVTFKEQNKIIDSVTKSLNEEAVAARESGDAYIARADAIGLNPKYVDKIKSGNYSIQELKGKADGKNEKLSKQIDEYVENYDKAQDAYDKARKFDLEISGYNNQKIENIVDDYDREISLKEAEIDYLNGEIALKEAKGESIDIKDYQTIQKDQQDIKKILQNKRKDIQEEFDNLNKLGKLDADSLKYFSELLAQIGVEILKCEENIVKLDDSIRKLKWEPFDRAQSKFDAIKDEISDLQNLLGDHNYDEFGNLTVTGTANVGLLIQGIAAAKQAIVDCSSAIEELNAEFEAGNNISESQYFNQLTELEDTQREAAQYIKNNTDALLKFRKDGIEATTKALSDQFKAQKELLSAQKEAADYAKTMEEKQKRLLILEKQIAALSLSSDRADIAEKIKLEKERADLQKDIAETISDHEYDLQMKAYDEQIELAEQYGKEQIENLENNLETQENEIKKFLKLAKDEYSTVQYKINETAKRYGIELTTTLTSPWDSAKKAAELYSQIVNGINTPSFDFNDSSGSLSSLSSALTYTGDKSGSADTQLNQYLISQGYQKLSWDAMAKLGQDLGFKDATAELVKSQGSLRMDILAALKAHEISTVLKYTGNTSAAAETELNQFIVSKGYQKLSWDAMAKLGQDLGIKDATAASVAADASIRKQILNSLKNAGFSQGGRIEIGDVIRSNGDNVLMTAKVGEEIITSDKLNLFHSIYEKYKDFKINDDFYNRLMESSLLVTPGAKTMEKMRGKYAELGQMSTPASSQLRQPVSVHIDKIMEVQGNIDKPLYEKLNNDKGDLRKSAKIIYDEIDHQSKMAGGIRGRLI